MAIHKMMKRFFGGGKKVKSKKSKVKSKKLKPKTRPTKAKVKRAVRGRERRPQNPSSREPAAQKAKPAAKVKKPKSKLKKGMHRAYLALGSNVGDREEYLEQAVFLLSKTPGVKVIKKSSNYESDAEGPGDQPSYLNAAVEIQTSLDPYKLLDVIHDSENALGRERDVDWGPRTIDIDILLYDDLIISDDKLQVPHPLMHERVFVLRPLAEIAPNAVHPALERTIASLYEERKGEAGDKYDDELPGFKDIRKGVPDDYERW